MKFEIVFVYDERKVVVHVLFDFLSNNKYEPVTHLKVQNSLLGN